MYVITISDLFFVDMQSKHDGIPFDPSACENAQKIHGGSTKGTSFVHFKKLEQRHIILDLHRHSDEAFSAFYGEVG